MLRDPARLEALRLSRPPRLDHAAVAGGRGTAVLQGQRRPPATMGFAPEIGRRTCLASTWFLLVASRASKIPAAIRDSQAIPPYKPSSGYSELLAPNPNDFPDRQLRCVRCHALRPKVRQKWWARTIKNFVRKRPRWTAQILEPLGFNKDARDLIYPSADQRCSSMIAVSYEATIAISNNLNVACAHAHKQGHCLHLYSWKPWRGTHHCVTQLGTCNTQVGI